MAGGLAADKLPFRMALFPVSWDKEKEWQMNIQKVLGILLVAGGGVLVVLGVTASDSVGNHLSNFFAGHPDNATLWFLICGVAGLVIGATMVFGRSDAK